MLSSRHEAPIDMLTNRTCLITGGSGGLGRRIAEMFWQAGANLVLVSHSTSELQETVTQLPPRSNQQLVTVAADLADQAAPEFVVQETAKAFSQLDVLVNTAAIQGPIGPLVDNDWAEWRTTIQVDLIAPAALCRLCIPWITRPDRRGKIINLSGGGAASPRPRFSAYAAAKAAIVRFTETIAGEIAERGIDINCVAPGPMATAMIEEIVRAGPEAAGDHEYQIALSTSQHGDRTIKTAASLCLFLASEASDGITGKLISAVWDPWPTLMSYASDIRGSDVYTLRRIVPKDRGFLWGERD